MFCRPTKKPTYFKVGFREDNSIFTSSAFLWWSINIVWWAKNEKNNLRCWLMTRDFLIIRHSAAQRDMDKLPMQNILKSYIAFSINLMHRGLSPGGRFPPGFIHRIIMITGLNKLYDCMLSPWRWPQMPTGGKTPTQTKKTLKINTLHTQWK